MSVTVVMLMTVTVRNRIAELLYRGLENWLRGLCCVEFDIYCLIVEGNLEVLYSFFECDVFLYLLHTIFTVKVHMEGNLHEFRLLFL